MKQQIITCTFVMHTITRPTAESPFCAVLYEIFRDFSRREIRIMPFVGRIYSEHKCTRRALGVLMRKSNIFILYMYAIESVALDRLVKFSFYSFLD